jgi:hypothetical protein
MAGPDEVTTDANIANAYGVAVAWGEHQGTSYLLAVAADYEQVIERSQIRMRCRVEKLRSCVLLSRPVTSCIIASSSAASVLRSPRDVTGRSHWNLPSAATDLLL